MCPIDPFTLSYPTNPGIAPVKSYPRCECHECTQLRERNRLRPMYYQTSPTTYRPRPMYYQTSPTTYRPRPMYYQTSPTTYVKATDGHMEGVAQAVADAPSPSWNSV